MASRDYHGDEICNATLQIFATDINSLLAINNPRYDNALNKISMCYEVRAAYSKNRFGQIDEAHQNVLNLLENLGGFITTLKENNINIPHQVTYEDNPMRFTLYSLNGSVYQVTSTGSHLIGGKKFKLKKSSKTTKRRKQTKTRKHKLRK